MKKISIISILYNEELAIDPFVKETVKILENLQNLNYEIIFINDASTDNSFNKLVNHHKNNPKIR